MLENGMIVGAEKYDPQCQDVIERRCAICKEWWPESSLIHYQETGDLVCPECRVQYLREQGADFVERYVESHPVDYYIGWWWKGLTEAEKLRAVKMVYWYYLTKSMKFDVFAKDRVEFCEDAENFLEFVEDKIK